MLDFLNRRPTARFSSKRAGAVLLGALALFVGCEATENAQANGDTRTLTLYHTHRGDTATITFKRDGRYDSEGLKQISYFLRDWRNQKQTRMEPRLFDIVWEAHRQVGRGGMINIVSAYRSPETNAFLRSRSNGVAKFSQHMLGRAMDFYITGVPVSAVREAGIRLQRGGVGFYPTSGRPFVHLDAGNIRAWPRMTRSQLAKIFPGGKTVHQPAEGGQMPGYQLAMAELKSRGDISGGASYTSSSSGRSFFARLFGGADEGDDAAESAAPATAVASRGAASSASDDEGGASAALPATKVATVRVPVPMSRPSDMVRETGEVVVATASVPMPPVAPRGAMQEMTVASARVPLPPVAPSNVSGKPVPLPPTAGGDGYELASVETAPAEPDMVWRTGAQPAGSASQGLAAASAVPTPRPRPAEQSAVAVLAALPSPTGEPKRQIDPQLASAYQAEASSFPKLPDAITGGRIRATPAEMALAYAPEAVVPATGRAATRAAVAPQTAVTATAPIDPNVRVLSPYATPTAVYAAATAQTRHRATLTAPEGMVTARMDGDTLRVIAKPVRAVSDGDMIHPDQVHMASLMVAPSAALVGGFGVDPNHGARVDRFSGSSVMLLRTQSFLPTAGSFAAAERGHG